MRVALPASGTGLGGTRFNERVVAGLVELMGSDLEVVRVASMRAKVPQTDRRLPIGALEKLPAPLVRGLGAGLWGREPLHRMDARLPPGLNEIVTVLDFAPLHFDDEGTVARWVIPSIRRAQGAICLSPSVANEVQAIADIPTWVCGAGVDDRFFDARPFEDVELRKLGVNKPFVLSVGGTTKRKNLQLLADCWPLVRREADLTLVSIGANPDARQHAFAGVEGVRVLGQVSDEWVPGIMAAAGAIAVPSLYEGFGMPVIEAMATGTPVVASNRSSLPWVCGNAGRLAEPEPHDFANSLLDVIHDADTTRRLVEAGRIRARSWTWSEVARLHRDVYTLGTAAVSRHEEIAMRFESGPFEPPHPML